MGFILSANENVGLKIVEESFKIIADYIDMSFHSLWCRRAGVRGCGEDKRHPCQGQEVRGRF
jgi:hypothetical protein